MIKKIACVVLIFSLVFSSMAFSEQEPSKKSLNAFVKYVLTKVYVNKITLPQDKLDDIIAGAIKGDHFVEVGKFNIAKVYKLHNTYSIGVEACTLMIAPHAILEAKANSDIRHGKWHLSAEDARDINNDTKHYYTYNIYADYVNGEWYFKKILSYAEGGSGDYGTPNKVLLGELEENFSSETFDVPLATLLEPISKGYGNTLNDTTFICYAY